MFFGVRISVNGVITVPRWSETGEEYQQRYRDLDVPSRRPSSWCREELTGSTGASSTAARQSAVERESSMRRAFRLSTRTTLVGCVMIMVLSFLAADYSLRLPRAGQNLMGHLTEVQKTMISTLIDLVKLLMTWALAIIGGMAFLIKQRTDPHTRVPKVITWSCIAAFLGSIVSVFSGHLVISAVIQMLSHNVFSLHDPIITVPAISQSVSLLIGLAGFSAYSIEVFMRRGPAFLDEQDPGANVG
jgi:hypothetical protein